MGMRKRQKGKMMKMGKVKRKKIALQYISTEQ